MELPKSESPTPINMATISSGFEKGDFLVREEKGQRVYFDFFEEAFNYIANKGYSRMDPEDEERWMSLLNNIHGGVKGGMRYNTGKLLMVLFRPIQVAPSSSGAPAVASAVSGAPISTAPVQMPDREAPGEAA